MARGPHLSLARISWLERLARIELQPNPVLVRIPDINCGRRVEDNTSDLFKPVRELRLQRRPSPVRDVDADMGMGTMWVDGRCDIFEKVEPNRRAMIDRVGLCRPQPGSDVVFEELARRRSDLGRLQSGCAVLERNKSVDGPSDLSREADGRVELIPLTLVEVWPRPHQFRSPAL